MIPEKPKDKWINAKDFSWFFEYDPSISASEHEWYARYHITMGILMQILADEAGHNGIEIVRCKDCKYYIDSTCRCYRFDGLSDLRSEDDFCSFAERKTDE